MAPSLRLWLASAAAVLLLLAPGSEACNFYCFFWQSNCKRTKEVYAQLVNLSMSQGRDKINNVSKCCG